MKLYIKAFSSYVGEVDTKHLKEELKGRYKLDTRRQDAFIHLALYGAELLKDKIDIESESELYITSGVGNIEVLQKTYQYVCQNHELIKPFDFINMLGNTISYYVANTLKIKNKNTFQISDNFTFINTLVSIFASLNISKNDAILGCVDLSPEPKEIVWRLMGISEEIETISAVNYQILSLSCEGAIGEVEFDTKIYSLEEIRRVISQSSLEIVCSMRCENLEYPKDREFFETAGSYYLNRALEHRRETLYVECFGDSYRLMKMRSLEPKGTPNIKIKQD